MKKYLVSIIVCFFALFAHSQTWKVEAEDEASSVTWKDGVATIVAPKGLTLWCE